MFGDLGAIKESLEQVAKQLKQLVAKLTPTNKLVSELIEENAALRKEMSELKAELARHNEKASRQTKKKTRAAQ